MADTLDDGMTGARFILEAIRKEGIDTVFLVPGGLVDPMLPEFEQAGIKAIVAAHEAGAAYMADGYARATGGIGVCIGIGGPGVANMVGPIASAYSDRSPVLVIAGEVPSDWEGRGAFQDASAGGLNDLEMMRPITKFALEVSSLESLEHDLKRAIHAMVGVERRPAFLSVPKQLQAAKINRKPGGPSKWTSAPPRVLDEDACKTLAFALRGTSRVAVLAGNGVDLSGAAPDLAAFAEKFDVPVATTLRAKGVLPENHALSLGTFGYAGTRHSTEALLDGDLEVLIVIGSTLSQRDTMMWNENLHPEKRLVQVDIDPTSFSQNYPVDTMVCSDAKRVLQWLMKDETTNLALEAGREARRTWYEGIRSSERFYDVANTLSDQKPIHPARVIAELRKVAPDETVMLVDSGAHRAFAGQYWEARHSRHYLTSTTMAPMGWAIPAALGAKMARPKKPTAVVTGDGCMLMHGIEIQSAAHHGVPIVFVVMNNHALGNVYLRAKKQGPSAADLVLLSDHDWAGFAKSLGADGVVVSDPDELPAAFERAFAAAGPFLVDVRCDPEAQTPIAPWVEAKREEAGLEEEEHTWMEDHYGS